MMGVICSRPVQPSCKGDYDDATRCNPGDGSLWYVPPPDAAGMAADKSHEGKVVSATEGKDKADGKLVMTDNDGKNEKTHSIPTTAKITVNGKAGKLSEIKKGDTVKVTVDDKNKVTAIAVTRT
jgi:hypothetical protein